MQLCKKLIKIIMKRIFVSIAVIFLSISISAQPKGFTELSKIKATSVKDQAQAGSCWSFATTSFIEAEVLRESNINVDISELFFVYYAYINRAVYFVRLQGHNNFAQGGQAHDVMDIVKEYGAVPEDAYPYSLKNHTQLEHDLKTFLDSIVALDNLPLNWKQDFIKILDSYLGAPPTDFRYDGKKYTPRTFATQFLKFDPNNYVEISSYTHHNFYEQFVLEVPDNWALSLYYNVHINELVSIIDSAIFNGYSVDWDGDVSEPGFNVRDGIANVSKDNKSMSMSVQPYRQQLFDRQTTTDDHLMHAIGVYKNAAGMKYYLIKNSWGDYGKFHGYLYMSEDYVKYHTIAILVNKNAIPQVISDRLNL